MVMMASMDLPMVRAPRADPVGDRSIIQQRRFPCGTRKITHVTEMTGIESGKIQTQDIFTFTARDQNGPNGRVRGEFGPTGAVPEFYEELASRGVPLDLNIFRPNGAER